MGNKLLKVGNPVSSPKRCLERMNLGDFEYVLFENTAAGAKFIARKSYVEKQAHNKSCMKREDHVEIKDDEVVKLGTNLTIDEVLFELDVHNVNEITFKEGKAKTTVSRSELNVISEVLYNPDFDCSVFWTKGNA